MVREKLQEKYPDTQFVLIDGFDDAILGIDSKTRKVIYDQEKILEILMEREGMDSTEAVEYFDFNIEGAYVGEKTPIYVEKL